MDINILNRSVNAYKKHLNMRLASREIGIPLSTLYVHLKRAGVAVIGDKSRYGSDTDRFATKAEREFERIVPSAQNQNKVKFQSKIDFMVGNYSIDVKASRLHGDNSGKNTRWMYSIKKQEFCADFFVCFGFNKAGLELISILLIPGEIARMYTTVSTSPRGGKWSEYEVTEKELHDFFIEMVKIPKEHP